MTSPTVPTVDAFATEARVWLDANAKRRHELDNHRADEWGVGEFSVAVFHALSFEQERDLLGEISAWHRQKAERGYHAITWPSEFGGLGLEKEHARAFSKLESEYETPTRHETLCSLSCPVIGRPVGPVVVLIVKQVPLVPKPSRVSTRPVGVV